MTQPASFERANRAREERSTTKAEDVLWLVVETGEEPARAARRVGTTLSATEKSLKRQGRIDDWHRILAARPLPIIQSRKVYL